MTSPLWILNSSLTLMCILSSFFMIFMRTDVPRRTTLTTSVPTVQIESDVSKVNPAIIYEHDLFGTFIYQTAPEKPAHEEIIIPVPPSIEEAPAYKRAEADFLPPLQIKLKGILLNSNALYSRAIIANTKTKSEKLYKIGDLVEDATIIHIYKNKIALVRSNGQQEVLFLNEEMAQSDPIYQGDRIWATLITQTGNSTFSIDSRGFKKKIQSVAQILELLDITTAFDKGKCIGCRVGQINQGSFGSLMGLQYEDIITLVNGIETTNPNNRVKIYQVIRNAGGNQTIDVEIMRNGESKKLSYKAHQITDDADDDVLDEEPIKNNYPAGTLIHSNGKSPQQTRPISKPEDFPELPVKMPGRLRTTDSASREIAQTSDNNITQMFKKKDQQSMLDFGSRNAFLQR
ncbi:MAG: hypothetical protein UV38_C0003G0204 [candidate division TM6 bacterium GW2011_GWE2_42_60]|nr:MAG: hypothetical protein UV38_C0003G0204 [candidate division TM6 bacterium GW2011_GWE2_42_60]HBY05823.1 hypothetical protein [Candidatus Dependentiae bacterium]